ncbi:MAG: hypothetical protein FWH20_08610 [Oscillospiraceae bacterium]|nr:hypothetical protein [Oscillospiraceae bacterium]
MTLHDFRTAYKAEYDKISPDKAVIEGILAKMHAEAANPGAARTRKFPTGRLAMAAAGICIIVGAAIVIPAILRDSGGEIFSGASARDNATIAPESAIMPEAVHDSPNSNGGNRAFDAGSGVNTEEDYEDSDFSDTFEEIAEIAHAAPAPTNPATSGPDEFEIPESRIIAPDDDLPPPVIPASPAVDSNYAAEPESENAMGGGIVTHEIAPENAPPANYTNFGEFAAAFITENSEIEAVIFEQGVATDTIADYTPNVSPANFGAVTDIVFNLSYEWRGNIAQPFNYNPDLTCIAIHITSENGPFIMQVYPNDEVRAFTADGSAVFAMKVNDGTFNYLYRNLIPLVE